MAKRVCSHPGCPQLVPTAAYRGLCDEHRKQRDRDRGTREQRGYGDDHRKLRAAWQRRINQGELVQCWRCGARVAGSRWHLGHDDHDRSITRGPECVECNLKAAGLGTKVIVIRRGR